MAGGDVQEAADYHGIAPIRWFCRTKWDAAPWVGQVGRRRAMRIAECPALAAHPIVACPLNFATRRPWFVDTRGDTFVK